MRLHRWFPLAVVLVLALAAAACGAKGASGAGSTPSPASTVPPVAGAQALGFQQWSVADLKQNLARKDFTLVNVHVPFEGRLAGTDLEIPYDKITGDPRLPPDRKAKLVLYCSSGRMSDIAARALVQAGYTNVVDVLGGMQAWQAAGNALAGK